MPPIKVKSFQEAKLVVLLHQSQRSEDAMAANIANLYMQRSRLEGEKAELERKLESMRLRAEHAERELRAIKALRYAPSRKRQGVDGVNA